MRFQLWKPSFGLASLSLALLCSCSFFTGPQEGLESESPDLSIASSFAAERFKQIKEGGKFKVAVSPNCPPFAFKNQDGQLCGLDIDIVNSVARELKLTPQFFETSPEAVSGLLRDGTADLGCGAFDGPSISRQFLVSTLEYLPSGQRAVIRSEAAAFISDPKQLDCDKITLLTVSGSTGSAVAGSLFPKAKHCSVANIDKGLEELKGGEGKALLIDNVDVLERDGFAGDPKLKVVLGFLTNERLAMAIRRCDGAWKSLLEEGMGRAVSSGEIGRLVGRYFPNVSCESINVKIGSSSPQVELKAETPAN